MLSINRDLVRTPTGLSRREWLRVGGLGALTLSGLLRGRAAAASSAGMPISFGRAKSCILCFLFGAPAHQDVWDLKPDAPKEVRGEFKPIASSVPGLFLGEHIPRIARTAHRFALLRSVAHPDNTHTVAMHYMLTGRRHAQPATNPRNLPSDFPCFGAVAQYLHRGSREAGRIANPSYGEEGRIANPSYAGLPAGISLNAPANQVSAANHIFPGFFAGILGSTFDPLFIAQDPSATEFRPFADVLGMTPLARLRLLSELDSRRRRMEEIASVRDFDDHYQRALSLVTSAAARRAFDLSAEPPTLRERYGRNSFGQGLLLARRLVEAGVRLVTVNWARDDAFWDTHSNNFRDLKQKLLPPFDLGFSALLEDLDARGMLSETLVVCLGEFGRTPKINAAAGRDHWAACNSVVMAGGGVQPGRVHGASDRSAAFPTTTPISPDDLAATIYHSLGIDPRMEIHDREGKPWQLSAGRVRQALF